jgi:hypothetical protein
MTWRARADRMRAVPLTAVLRQSCVDQIQRQALRPGHLADGLDDPQLPRQAMQARQQPVTRTHMQRGSWRSARPTSHPSPGGRRSLSRGSLAVALDQLDELLGQA